jgi:hypothetical protein
MTRNVVNPTSSAGCLLWKADRKEGPREAGQKIAEKANA